MGLLYYGQNYLIYPSAFPPGSRDEVPTPAEFSLPYTDLELTTSDGVKLKCYLLLQRPDLHVPGATKIEWDSDGDDEKYDMFAATRPTIIMFHGNGGNHGHRIPLAKIFFAKMRCNVLMLSYRGYGRSEGTPSEKGLVVDAQTGLDYVLQHETLSKTPIILYGQSIGGAVAIDLASKNTQAITAMILENTFMSLPRLIPTAFPILTPFSWLCHQKWESYLKVPKIPKSIRVLMLGGAIDEVVPRAQMQGLWALIRSRPSGDKYMEFPAGGHNDTCIQAGYWTAVAEFIASLSPLAELARAERMKTEAADY
ncbi:Alpha/beta hydrolase [Heterobasidion irregulare TC 32-1]|uniref:Alpha/beta hydrolase n=1 Tax=Heterobasidion irregulare (strain TC 32-1) TaxID=747525 RepID=W4JPA9_HETIT|nr:Alpha/beta hydrolase [Heterobasidion irregulare TC 32-1]ETW75299.1 Alpha/beta hydrolase [Heterobasidion irregulare TC 32-1]